MPDFKLTDLFGLSIDVQPAPASAFLKYFQQLAGMRLDSLDLKALGGLTLDEPAIQSVRSGVSFDNPLKFGDKTPAFSVSAGANGFLQVIRDASELPDQEGAPALSPGFCYVAFGVEATASVNAAASAGSLAFGAVPSGKLEAVSYSRFPLAAGVTLQEAVSKAVANYSIPLSSADLCDFRPGQMTKVSLTARLSISGSADFLMATNPLATVNLPEPLPAVSVTAGGSATIGATVELESEFELVARRLETGPVRLGWYRTSSSDATVRARISEGASAVFGSTDVFSQVIGAISAAPTVDLEELKNAWVPPEQARAIQSAVKAAISRKLELAAETEFSLGNSRGASFLFEIDPVALSRESRDALDEALRGDLTRLHQGALPGIRCLQSGWESMRKRTLELDVNLLGIFNFRSFATLALKGRVLYDPATGALVVCDRATADRVRSSQVNFGADTDKLRHVLAESFFLTAAYQGARQLAAPATLLCGHRFFELKASTSRDDISHKLRVGVGLGLLSLDEARLPENTTPFGRTLFTVSTDYNETMVAAMFLDSSGGPHSRETYEMCGRVAIQFLVQDSDADAVRRRPAIEADLWRQMKAAGQPGFAALFPGVAAPLVYAIAADFTTIQWWADAMRNTAEKLSAIRQWLERNPAGRMDDPAYTELRNELANHLRDVAATTREEFGRPWGLLAMNQLVERGSGAKFRIMGPKILIERRRDLAAVTRP